VVSILGISAFYHDSAACLVVDGDIVAAAQEERFSRVKHDHRFPIQAARYCLAEANLTAGELDFVGFYDKPLLKFDRLLETYLDYSPSGFRSFLKSMPLWMSEKLWMPDLIRTELAKVDGEDDERAAKKRGRKFKWKLLFGDHHESHAASAFYPSPFNEAAILTIDGVGEWATSSIGVGKGNELTLLQELRYPNSVGLLYSAFTYYTGFKVNSGEYKVMGLAPYGEPRYVSAIKDHLLEVKDDGSIKLNQDYFNYSQGLRMTNGAFDKLFGGPPRKPESTITQRDMDLARSVQVITEEVMLKMAQFVQRETGMKYLCLAGGVALNCVGNGRVRREVPFEDIWIQPAAGDAGGALGVALAIWHRYLEKPRDVTEGDAMKGSYLGPSDSEADIEAYLESNKVRYTKYAREQVPDVVAGLLAEGKVIGLHQGRMEFGPRALGCRSIIGDARLPQMQSVMNQKIKFRESFRPFAPSVLREHVSEWFELDADSPYMSLVAQVKRLEIPAVTHVDHSARVQTVTRETNPLYWEIIEAFRKRTGCPVIVNTSFNVRGEPIVCTPADSYRCFMRTEMDYLVLETLVLSKDA
jgi:carbamoyltransferase